MSLLVKYKEAKTNIGKQTISPPNVVPFFVLSIIKISQKIKEEPTIEIRIAYKRNKMWHFQISILDANRGSLDELKRIACKWVDPVLPSISSFPCMGIESREWKPI